MQQDSSNERPQWFRVRYVNYDWRIVDIQAGSAEEAESIALSLPSAAWTSPDFEDLVFEGVDRISPDEVEFRPGDQFGSS